MKKQTDYKLITEFLVGSEKYCVVRTPGGCSAMTEMEYTNLCKNKKYIAKECA